MKTISSNGKVCRYVLFCVFSRLIRQCIDKDSIGYGVREIFSDYSTIRRVALVFISVTTLFLMFPTSLLALDVLIVKSSNIKPYHDVIEGFKSSCGCTVIDELTSHDRSSMGIRQEVDNKRPSAVLTVGIDALRSVQEVGNVPIVSVMAPLSSLPESGNISGVNMIIPPVLQLSAILDLFPGVKNIGILGTAKSLESHHVDLPGHAKSRGVVIIMKRVSKAGDVVALLEEMKGKIDLLWMVPDVRVVNEETVRSMMLFSFRNSVPIFSFSRKYVDMGAAATLHVEPYDMGVQAGEIVRSREYAGNDGRPVRVPGRSPRLIINKKVVKKMGLRINEELFRKAADVE